MSCKYCHLVEHVTVFPYYCQCGKVYGTSTPIPKPLKPGTELKKLISWLPLPGKTGCQRCKSLEAKMNRWGPEKCLEKMDYICKKLHCAAKRRHIPYSRRLVEILVKRACKCGQ